MIMQEANNCELYKSTFLGLVLVGPTLHFWYGYLARKYAENTFHNVLRRLVLDQFAFTPVFITVFMSSVLLLDGRPENVRKHPHPLIMPCTEMKCSILILCHAQIPDKLSSEFSTVLMANYSVWVPAMFLNFKFIPPHFQVLFSNSIGYLWNVYLSFASHRNLAEKEKKKKVTRAP